MTGPEHDATGGGGGTPCADPIAIGHDPAKGRTVTAATAIRAETIIDTAPVVVLSAEDCRHLDTTLLGHYYFHWDGDFDGDGRGAIALGLVSLCNHAATPNAAISRRLASQAIDLVALRDIAAGEEITIDYGCALWFDPVS